MAEVLGGFCILVLFDNLNTHYIGRVNKFIQLQLFFS